MCSVGFHHFVHRNKKKTKKNHKKMFFNPLIVRSNSLLLRHPLLKSHLPSPHPPTLDPSANCRSRTGSRPSRRWSRESCIPFASSWHGWRERRPAPPAPPPTPAGLSLPRGLEKRWNWSAARWALWRWFRRHRSTRSLTEPGPTRGLGARRWSRWVGVSRECGGDVTVRAGQGEVDRRWLCGVCVLFLSVGKPWLLV